MGISDDSENIIIKLYAREFYQIRTLCDEIMANLCQAKAMLEPISEDDFFERFEAEGLRHYFYALDTIINGALGAKDKICHVIDNWEKGVRRGVCK